MHTNGVERSRMEACYRSQVLTKQSGKSLQKIFLS